MSQSPWRPQGVLIAHLAEHRQSVNQLAVAGNGMFFASASSDETVKVWDCRRLEKDVSFKSRLSYTAQGELLWSVRLKKLSRGDKVRAAWVIEPHMQRLAVTSAAVTADGVKHYHYVQNIGVFTVTSVQLVVGDGLYKVGRQT